MVDLSIPDRWELPQIDMLNYRAMIRSSFAMFTETNCVKLNLIMENAVVRDAN